MSEEKINEEVWNNIDEKTPIIGLWVYLKENKDDEEEVIGCLFSKETICFYHDDDELHTCPLFQYFVGKLKHPKWWSYVGNRTTSNVPSIT